MGGRGAFSATGKLIDKRWKTKAVIEGIKVIEPVDGKNNGKVPMMSRSPNAKYAIINSKGNLKSIVEYDENREIKKEHHFDHSDGGKNPHTMIIKKR